MGLVVLIIDDDEAVRFFHHIIVSHSGLPSEALGFCNGEEALNYLDINFNRANKYLILLDINMPVMNGWDVLDILNTKSYCGEVNIVIVTSSVNKADHVKSKLYNSVIALIEKPISVEEYKRIMNFYSYVQNF